MKEISEGVWISEKPLTFFGIPFDARMTAMQDASGGICLYSPVAITDEIKQFLAAKGPVRLIIGPNPLHHLWLKDAATSFPDAAVWVPPGLAKRKPKLADQIPNLNVLQDDCLDVDGAITILRSKGAPRVDELVVLHRPSQTLAVCDLIMNIHDSPSLLSRSVFWLEGCLNQPNVPRLVKLLTRDKKEMRRLFDEIEALGVSSLIPAHGEVITDNAQETLRKCFQWVI